MTNYQLKIEITLICFNWFNKYVIMMQLNLYNDHKPLAEDFAMARNLGTRHRPNVH